MRTRWRGALWIVLFAALIAVFVCAVWVAEQNHPPATTEHRAEPREKDRGQGEDEGFWGKAIADPVAAFTGILTLFTAVLAAVSIVQIGFLTRADETARISANAARSAAEAVPRVERAYVFVESVIGPNVNKSVALGDPEYWLVKYTFKNHGRTPAICDQLSIGMGYREEKFPPFTESDRTHFTAPMVIAAGEVSKENTYRFPVFGRDYDRAKAGVGAIRFRLVLGYLDIFGNRHELGSGGEWSFDEGRFVVPENDTENRYT